MNVLQDWVCDLTLMQQSVLLTSLRGADGMPKDHVSKLLIRWLRRCVLISAFDKCVLTNPADPRGGSFTGPSLEGVHHKDWSRAMHYLLKEYMRTLDEVPHHFQLHFMHAAEIIGYKHPDREVIGEWWMRAYFQLANDMHLTPERETAMDRRLGDRESDWRAAEEVTAKSPEDR